MKKNSDQITVVTTLAFAPDDIAIDIYSIEDSTRVAERPVGADQLSIGEYYARLTARASNGPERFWQLASNIIEVESLRHDGVIQFTTP